MNVKNALHNTLELYKTKHPQNAIFTFIHRWLVPKDVPCFGDVCAKSQKLTTPSMKCKSALAFDATIQLDGSEV
jgi:hypothetical protein